uniref:Uncharacterized protein n=1 Tax=Vespula pensylvanica TaxID=30213 RepID=A0A834PFG0_VESPE|nr:hypothetical protein H0235_000931 [Vespula pensylvanica]
MFLGRRVEIFHDQGGEPLRLGLEFSSRCVSPWRARKSIFTGLPRGQRKRLRASNFAGLVWISLVVAGKQGQQQQHNSKNVLAVASGGWCEASGGRKGGGFGYLVEDRLPVQVGLIFDNAGWSSCRGDNTGPAGTFRPTSLGKRLLLSLPSHPFFHPPPSATALSFLSFLAGISNLEASLFPKVAFR